jgi:hypothetical protein
MNIASIDSQSQITQAGTFARSCLASGQRGTVLAAFSQAVYLLTEMGDMFWITTADAPMHRRCLQTVSPLPGLSAGARFQVRGQILVIDPFCSLEMGSASEWHEPYPDQVVELDFLYSRIHTFFTTMDYSQARGFGIFIPSILSLFRETPVDLVIEPSDPILIYARPLVMNMAGACLNHQPPGISQSADSLIGLGAGLTPSGDDFLGGMFFALKTLQSYYPDMVCREYLPALESNHSRTHLISFTLLNDLANGHAVAPLHHIINGLLSGESTERLYPFVSQLNQVGHSTGWDLLTGLLVGLLTTYRSHYFFPSFQLTKSMRI